MATATTLISIEEYLRTMYHPDRDYVDGEVQERNLGERDHGRLQIALSAWFFNNEAAWDVYAIVEQRIRVGPRRVRIADVCLVNRSAPKEQVTVTPPLLCVEILSPEDRLPRAARVMDDYARMGVPNLWLLDPTDRVAYVYAATAFSSSPLTASQSPTPKSMWIFPPSSPRWTSAKPISGRHRHGLVLWPQSSIAW